MDCGTVEHDPSEVPEVEVDIESAKLLGLRRGRRTDFLEHVIHELVAVPLPPTTVLVEVITQLSELHRERQLRVLWNRRTTKRLLTGWGVRHAPSAFGRPTP